MTKNQPLSSNRRSNTKHVSSFESRIGTRETAQYIADMVLELRNMALSVELKTLQGLLEVSFYEAFSAANKIKLPPDEIEHLRALSRASVS